MVINIIFFTFGFKVSRKDYFDRIGHTWKNLPDEYAPSVYFGNDDIDEEDKEEILISWWENRTDRPGLPKGFVIQGITHDQLEDGDPEIIIGKEVEKIDFSGRSVPLLPNFGQDQSLLKNLNETYPIWDLVKDQTPALYATTDDCGCCS